MLVSRLLTFIANMLKITFVLCLWLNIAYSASLPPYITPCALSDPNLNKCLTETANKVIPEMLKGDKKHKIPEMLPLILPKIDLSTGSNLRMVLTDASIGNLISAKVTDMTLDKDKQEIVLKVDIDPMKIESNYEISGQILILPITGNGPTNITLANGHYVYTMKYKTVSKNGEDHYAVDSASLDFDVSRAHFFFGNLFNGDQRLGDEMNKFIDENWQDFLTELRPATIKIMLAIVNNLFEGYFSTVPAKEIFKP